MNEPVSHISTTSQKYSFWESILFPPLWFSKKKLEQKTQNKTILITGASYGIGESTARLLASKDTHLVLVARSTEKLEELKTQLEQTGATVTLFTTDLSKEKEVDLLVQALQALPHGIDIIISNAGKSIRRNVFDSLDRFHDFQRTMQINYFGPVQLLLKTIPLLEKNKGHLINISAINVLLTPAPGWAAYQASKTAFDQWLRSVSPELRLKGIDTSTLYLPLVRTRMIAPTAAYNKMPAMQPDHVARLIAHCINTHKKQYAPWWMFLARLGSALFGKSAARYMARREK